MAISKKIREQVWLKYDKHCGYCGKNIEFKEMQVDHIIPVCYPPAWLEIKGLESHNDLKNLMPACRRCNHYKRATDLEGFRGSMKTIHERIRKDYLNKVAEDYGIIEVRPFDGVFYYEKHKSI